MTELTRGREEQPPNAEYCDCKTQVETGLFWGDVRDSKDKEQNWEDEDDLTSEEFCILSHFSFWQSPNVFGITSK